ncbi:tetratricopeptide repeat protein [Larkinella sp. VNQ87]|uniref:tetratricopeptide repeat protein n=1 Tax=Larkinella sp. VNQ87 TaxID=3400921 RepID=UPI003BFEA7A5
MKKFCLFLFFLFPFASPAQLLNDADIQQVILKATDKIYNYEFDEAEEYIRQVKVKYPQHPVVPVLKAVQMYWQFLPLNENKSATAQYMSYLNQGIALSKKLLDRNENDPEGVFFALASHGYLAMKYHYDDETMKAVGEAQKAYGYLKKGFKLMEKNPEFYFSTGLYNYYIERYPADHPVSKPLLLFFQDGDMALGLKQMETASRRGLFTRTETAIYLSHIYLEHESQPARAAYFMKPLADKYPKNPIFNLECAEGLVQSGRYREAQPYLERLQKMPQRFLAMPVSTLEGLIEEKLNGDLKGAAEKYQAAIKLPMNAVFTKQYAAHSYSGLARIAAQTGDRNRAKSMYKKALDLAGYKSTIREAKSYLKS